MGDTTRARTREATFGAVIGMAEFRVLWIAATQSELGDQLARVALSLLVFDATASAVLTALTYALTFLPPLVTGPLLAGLADRFPRRTVMVVTDAACAVLVALMALPGMPLALMLALLTMMVALRPLFQAARTAIVPQLLGQERTVVGLGLLNMTQQSAQVLGFACGGAMVGWIGARPALAIDAATFVVGAVLARVGLRHRPPAADAKRPQGMRAGVRLVWTDRRLRHLVLLAWLYGFFVVPEGLAAPYAAELGAGPVAVGMLLAAGPFGAAAGALIFTRWVPPARQPGLIGPLAILSGVPLALLTAGPTLPVVLLFLALSGAFTTYVVLGLGALLKLVPDTHRGQASACPTPASKPPKASASSSPAPSPSCTHPPSPSPPAASSARSAQPSPATISGRVVGWNTGETEFHDVFQEGSAIAGQYVDHGHCSIGRFAPPRSDVSIPFVKHGARPREHMDTCLVRHDGVQLLSILLIDEGVEILVPIEVYRPFGPVGQPFHQVWLATTD